MRPVAVAAVCGLALCVGSCAGQGRHGDALGEFAKLAMQNDKPFVIVAGKDGSGQGVVITGAGHVLTAAHVTYDEEADAHTEEMTVSFRKATASPWPGMVEKEEITVVDAGHADFCEEYYRARLIKQGERAHIDGKDVALLKVETTEWIPHVEFYSRERPEIRVGDRLYMCQYCFPTEKADPIFVVTPLEVIGVARTPTGLQYLAQGFFRWGSSGAAILKEGKLIGIQSNAYTVNSDAGEVPLGHVSFEVVYERLVKGLVEGDMNRQDAKKAKMP